MLNKNFQYYKRPANLKAGKTIDFWWTILEVNITLGTLGSKCQAGGTLTS